MRGKKRGLLRRCAMGIAAALTLSVLTSAALPPARAEAAGIAQEGIKACTIKVSEGKRSALTDGNVRTGWTYSSADAQVAVAVPDGVAPGMLLLYWRYEPSGFELLEYDAAKSLLRTRDLSSTFPAIVMAMDLLEQTKYVFLRMTAPGQELVEMKLYSAGEMPEEAQVWEPPVEKAALMVVSTHQDDELIFFGGTIPYYAVARKLPTVVVYMADCTRYRRQEALNGLWAMGVRNYPDFINLTDKRVTSIDEGIELWGGQENILRELVQRIRRYRPEVIVTHDFDGEYGHNQHKITARAMQYAINAAADPQYFPETVALYGAWQVKKLYIHLYDQNQLYMDWKTPLDALGGISPLTMAQVGYAEHASQHKYYQVEEGGKYDNAKFGLYFTTVGYDTGLNDMFENIPGTALPAEGVGAESEPVPTEVPASPDGAAAIADVTATVEGAAAIAEETASPEDGNMPEAEPAETAAPPAANESASHVNAGAILGGAAAAAAVGGGVAWALRARRLRRRRRRRRTTARSGAGRTRRP